MATIIRIIEDESGEEREIEIPAIWEICHECAGNGRHSRGVEGDGGGITSSEWADWEAEEREGYFRGDYDRPCEVCDGTGKTLEPDYSSLPESDQEALVALDRDLAIDRLTERSERRAGA